MIIIDKKSEYFNRLIMMFVAKRREKYHEKKDNTLFTSYSFSQMIKEEFDCKIFTINSIVMTIEIERNQLIEFIIRDFQLDAVNS